MLLYENQGVGVGVCPGKGASTDRDARPSSSDPCFFELAASEPVA